MRLILVFGCVLSMLASCGGDAFNSALTANEYRLTGALSNVNVDSLSVFALDGFNYKKIGSVGLDKTGDSARFKFQGTVPRPGFYYVGTSLQNVKSIPLGGDEVSIRGNGGQMAQVSVKSSTLKQYSTASQGFQQLQVELTKLGSLIATTSDGSKETLINQANNAYTKQKQYVDSIIQLNTIVGKSLRLEMMPPFLAGKSSAPTPAHHYASNYLKEADLKDPDYAYLPLVDKMQEYTSRLTQMGFETKDITKYLEAMVNRIPNGSIAQKNALARMVYALEVGKHAAYPQLVEKYLAVSPNDPRANVLRQNAQQLAQKARAEAEANARFAPGMTPPEIALKTPKGKTVRLSDMKGKVVMIDFWASWCGPCRRENPNVVKLYKKYKKKGFEILGVSLDKDKARWVQAIEKDQLDWVHVSDLKFWQSAAAADYGVRGIPATFLLDKDGKMIAKGLRGGALERKLEEIFGA